MNFKTTLGAAAIAMAAPFAASAAVVETCDANGSLGGNFDIANGDSYNCDFTVEAPADPSSGSVRLDFFSNVIPASAVAATVNLGLFGDTFTTATLEWFDEPGDVSLGSVNLADLGFGFSGSLGTNFAGPAQDDQYVVLSWTGFSGEFLDVNISVSQVPVPAGILLMGTALAGFGVARRRKDKKAA